MSVHDRREREKSELRKKILIAAMDIISESGHEKLTIRDIAARIEYSPRTIYLYFANKEHLMREVVEEGFRETINRRMQNKEAMTGNPVAVLERQIRGHIAMAFSRPNLYRAIVSVVSSRDHEPGPAERTVIAQTYDTIARLSEREISKPETELLADIMFSSVRAFTLLLLNREGSMTAEMQDAAITMFAGFAAAGIQRS